MNALCAMFVRLSNRFGWKKLVFISGLLISGAVIADMVPPGAFNQGSDK